MQITHEEAHRLIQFHADEVLNSQQKAVLFTHLQDCIECQDYAEEIKRVESTLSSAMKGHWNIRPVPLSIESIVSKKDSKAQAGIILATRTAAIGFVFVAFVFSLWQFAVAREPSSNLPLGVLPVPTPSVQTAQSTSTKMVLQNCGEIRYTVQENDTLESIAYQFSITKEEIMAVNQMNTETVYIAMELRIPFCDSTPTGTVHPMTLTTTYTPAIHRITSTPDG